MSLISYRDRATGAALQAIARDLGLTSSVVVLTRYGYEVPLQVAQAFEDMGGVHLSAMYNTSAAAAACNTGNSCVGPPGPPGPPGFGIMVKGTITGTDTPLPASPEIGDLWIIGDPVPAGLPPNASDCGGGGGGGGGSIEGAVASSTAGDGPPVETMAVYSGAGFSALVTKDPNTYYVLLPPAGGQGSLYLGDTLMLGTLLAVPGAPPGVSVSPGDTTATINWGTATAGGLSITGYTVQRSLSETTGFANVGTVSGSLRTFTNTGLTNGTRYYYRVLATNAMGNGSPSIVVNTIPVTASVTALVSSDTSADAGSPVTFTATITAVGGTVNNGSVTFKRDGNNMITGVAVNGSGVATFTTSSLPIGSYTITAVFDGGTSWLPSTSNPVTQVMNFAGGPAPVTATLVSDDASSTPGQPVTFTVTVTINASGLPATSGTVVFKDGATTLTAPRAIDSAGMNSYTNSGLIVGTHPITAEFSGAPFYESDTSNVVSQVVAVGTGAAPIAQTMFSSKPLVADDELVSLRTTIKSGTTPVTSGSIVFKDGATVLGPGTPLNIYGESYFHTYALTVGTHLITAEYDGTPAFETDVSAALTQVVSATIPAPSPNDWQTAFDSGNLAQITAWYDYNCGHLTEGFTNADLWNPAGPGSIANVNVNAGWLAANEGPNVVETSPDHWTITGLHTSQISARASHLTFNHCWIERRDYEHIWGPGFGVYDEGKPEPKTDNVTIGDFELNHCTFTTDGTGGDSTFGDAMTFLPVTPIADDLRFNYCEVTQWTAAFKIYHGTTVNYCYVHDLDLFGFDPHNTSASIRGRQNLLYRNLFCDGTSSDVSLYADTNPFTDFKVVQNVMWVLPTHASQEVNFPNRGTGWSPLLPGYVREFTDNKLERGGAGDNQYWSKVTGNTYLDGRQLFGGADTVQVPGVPTLLAGPSSIEQFGAAQELISYHYTPSPSSTLLYFHSLGRANHAQNPNLEFDDESGALWSLVPGCETPVEPSPGPLVQYGLSASLWTQQTPGAAQAFRRVILDPYATLSNLAYTSACIVEWTGHTSMVLAQPAVQSAAGHLIPYGTTLPSMTTGLLGVNATAGNMVMLFVAYGHNDPGAVGVPSGWNVLGNRTDGTNGAAVLWRTDFTGRSVTLSDMGPINVCQTILCEFAA